MTFILIYTVMALYVGRRCGRWDYQDSLAKPQHEHNAGQNAVLSFIFGAALWPLVSIVYLIRRFVKFYQNNLTAVGEGLGALLVRAAAGKPASIEKKRRRLELMQQKTAQLERELELNELN